MKDLEKIYKALANRRRLEIIKFLKQAKEAPVGEIANHLRLSFRSTSKHLAILKQADIVDRDQRGLLVYYFLNFQYHPSVKQALTLV